MRYVVILHVHLVLFAGVWTVFCAAGTAQASAVCRPVDFARVALVRVSSDPRIDSVLLAYDGLRFDFANGRFTSAGKFYTPDFTLSNTPAAALKNASFADQFRQVYPLRFDRQSRNVPWSDPGRFRNREFLEFLYSSHAADIEPTLVRVQNPAEGAFLVTSKNNVACQLRAALASIPAQDYFALSNAAGGFAWRTIAGTQLRSVHSYGAALDINAAVGGYWRWSDAEVGRVGPYQTKVPASTVAAFERYGFIWGGKWHHFDGMHFEYRPELIIYARFLVEGAS